MVDRALRIRTGLDNITALERDLRDFELSEDEWKILTEIKKYLEPFASVTKNIEGSLYPTLSVVIPLYNVLIDHIEDWIDNNQDDDEEPDGSEYGSGLHCPEITAGAIAAKTKLLEYYNKTSEIYIVSVIMDPRLKIDYFSVEDWGLLIETEVRPA
jgi:hypothetical protein